MKALPLTPIGLGLTLAFLALASPASAQYMYLDTDGDGVHTDADQIHAVGPTVIDIWFDIAHNRDGSPVACNADPRQTLTMFGYVVNLLATDGTVVYSEFTNRVAKMGLSGALYPPDDTWFATGPYYVPPGTALAPGKYLLGSLTLEVTSGTPSLQIITWRPGYVNRSDPTMFGTNCDATLYPNSYLLGTDWFDADGLPFGAGGMVNRAPTMSQPTDMEVLAGENAVQAITAADADAQPLTFAKASGPPFLFVATTDEGTGSARGEIRLAPRVSDIGSSSARVSVTDGEESDEKSFGVTVSPTQNHPPKLFPLPEPTVVAGSVRRILLSAGDADGGALHVAKIAGPSYAILRELARGDGGAAASLTLSPNLCDVGTRKLLISLSDGASQGQSDLDLTVVAPTPPPTSPQLRFVDSASPRAVGLGDLNGDGNLDVVAGHEGPATISVFLGRGNGDLAPPVTYAIGTGTLALAVADLDRDGAQDVIVANTFGAGVSVLLGAGDGTLLPKVEYPTGNEPWGVVAADINLDGFPDVLTSNRLSASVSVLLGRGDGTLAPDRETPVGRPLSSLTVADINLDGRPDVGLTHLFGTASAPLLTILPGLGDGWFGDALPTSAVGFPITLMSGDWNWDGAIDLAVTDYDNGAVRTFSGRGDGTFVGSGSVAIYRYPLGGATGDLNGDGNEDIVVTEVNDARIRLLLGDGTGGFSSPTLLPAFGIDLAIGDLNSDGRPDIVSTGGLAIYVYLNRFGPTGGVAETRAFTLGGHRTIPEAPGGGRVWVRMEPVGDSYRCEDVDLSSVTLRSEGTGTVGEIHAVSAKNTIVGDTDSNGIPEIGVSFAQTDVAALFNQVRSRGEVTAQISGSLIDRRVFCTDFQLNLARSVAENPRTSFGPNPLNPQSKLRFVTEREGPAKAQLFDIHGRLVRTLLDTPRLAAGEHEFPFDGKNDRGRGLPSGVLYYRVESTAGEFRGQIVILK